MGGRADHHRHTDRDAAVVGPAQSLVWITLGVMLLCGLVGFLRRLPEARGEEHQGHAGALEVFLVVGGRSRCGVAAVVHREDTGRNHLLRAAVQACGSADGGRCLRRAHLPDDRRHEQRGESHRWLDGLAIMPAAMVATALGIFAWAAGNAIYAPYLGIPEIPGAGEIAIFCGAMAGAGPGLSCGSTPIRRRCSWATSVRSHWAARSVSSR